MVGLPNTLAQIPEGSTRRVYGTAYYDGTEWFAEVSGNLLTCRWNDPFQPLQGGNIIIDITNEGRGQHSALVVCGYTFQPRPSRGVVLTATLPEIVVTGEFGGTFTTDRFIDTLAIGDPVYLVWDAAKPTVIGKVAVDAAQPAAPPPAGPKPAPVAVRPKASTGTSTLIATASDTYGVGGWGRWATSQYGGQDVYTGTWGGYALTGAWFYGAAKPVLAGKTIDRVRFRVPQRLDVGASGSATIHVYAHTASSRPGGDVSRTAGPQNITVTQGQGPHWVDLPTSFGAVLAAGGGISIAGDPYAGFASRLDDPQAGKILIDWST